MIKYFCVSRQYVNLVDLTALSSDSEGPVDSDTEFDQLPDAVISLASQTSSQCRK